MSDENRKIVLGRRARFVAAALAGMGSAAALDACKPQVCLEPAYVPEDAAPDAEAGTDTSDAGKKDAFAEPQPCLSQAPDLDGGDKK